MNAKTILIGGAVIVAIAALASSAKAATPPPETPPITTGTANITAILPSTATMPNGSEIDIDFLWKNIGDLIGPFVPKVSIDGGIPIDLEVGTIWLRPGETYPVVKALKGLSLITRDSHTVCPVPN